MEKEAMNGLRERKTTPAKNIDQYLQELPDDVRITLGKLRQTIKATAPKAEEIISYQVPTYKYMGPLVCFAAYKDHCSLFVVSKNILKIFEKELQGYKTSGTTIHFTPEKPLPSALVQKIVQTRIQENEVRTQANKSNKPTVKKSHSIK